METAVKQTVSTRPHAWPEFTYVHGRLIDHNGFSRRANLWYQTKEERALRRMHEQIEQLGAHPDLTAASVAILDAKDKLADWIDRNYAIDKKLI